MRNDVIVVPEDNLIIVDGSALSFDFEAPDNLHAIQWHNGVGEMEFTDDLNQAFDETSYDDDVAPFVSLWEIEKASLEALQASTEAEALALYNSTEARAERVRTERDARITACDWIISRHAEQVALGVDTTLTDEEYAAWLSYRQALRDLTDVEGFPWSGGGADDEDCPWPVEPSTVIEQEE